MLTHRLLSVNSRIEITPERLEVDADATGITLYQANLRVYQIPRYRVAVQVAIGKQCETVHLIDGHHPERNVTLVSPVVS